MLCQCKLKCIGACTCMYKIYVTEEQVFVPLSNSVTASELWKAFVLLQILFGLRLVYLRDILLQRLCCSCIAFIVSLQRSLHLIPVSCVNAGLYCYIQH